MGNYSQYYNSLAVAARKLQRFAKAQSMEGSQAFAVLDQALVMLTRCNVSHMPVKGYLQRKCGETPSSVQNVSPVYVPAALVQRVEAIAASLTVHVEHCKLVKQDIHFAATAAVKVGPVIGNQARDSALAVHRKANTAKHDKLTQASALTCEIQPPANQELRGAVLCRDLEAVLLNKLQQPQPCRADEVRSPGISCSQCGLWTPINGAQRAPMFRPFSGTRWNLHAAEYVPRSLEDAAEPGVKVCIQSDWVLDVNLDSAKNIDGGAVPYDCHQQ